MHQTEKSVTRRKMVGWLGILSVFSVAGAAFRPWKTKKKPQMVKMLAQDGTLVEIDASLLAKATKKVTDKELQTWVAPKSHS